MCKATSYFYGYTRLLETREQVEVAQGKSFDLLALNDFILAQGLLPPDQLGAAVAAKFIDKKAAH